MDVVDCPDRRACPLGVSDTARLLVVAQLAAVKTACSSPATVTVPAGAVPPMAATLTQAVRGLQAGGSPATVMPTVTSA